MNLGTKVLELSLCINSIPGLLGLICSQVHISSHSSELPFVVEVDGSDIGVGHACHLN